MTDKKKIKEVLLMSNTSIRKLRKGDLVDIVIQIKSVMNDKEVGSSEDVMGIELLTQQEELVKLRQAHKKLMERVGVLRTENEVIKHKAGRKVKLIAALKLEINDLNASIKKSWWQKII